MKVPYLDVTAAYRRDAPALRAAMDRVFRGGRLVLGGEVRRFEAAFARACGSRHGVGVASGTDALVLALKAAGIGPGDQVVSSAHGFVATAMAVVLAGARPVLVDCNPEDGNIDPVRLRAAVTRRTKAVIAVHLYGRPADMDAVRAAAPGRIIIEDAAQAHGARLRGRPCGSLGDIACFSFYPTKNLGAFGDAGMVLTSDARIASRLRLLRDYGRTSRHRHLIVGHNSRLDELQAAFLSVRLRRLARDNARRRRHAAIYRRVLAGAPCRLPPEGPGDIHHVFAVHVEGRERVRRALAGLGVTAEVHYPVPVHLQPAFAFLGYKRGDFPVAERFARSELSLPVAPELTDGQVLHAARALRRLLDRTRR